MKKLVCICIFFSVGLISCTKVSEQQVRDVMQEYISANSSFISSMQKAKMTGQLVRAVDAYSESLKAILPKMKQIEAADSSISFKKRDFPFKYNDLKIKIEDQERAISLMIMKASGYAHFPSVKEAFERLTLVFKNR